MPTRIEIELTSSSPDGSWTWRAAGAREPRGVLDGSILPGGAAVGDQLRVETEHDVDGIRVLSVVPPKEKAARTDLLELLPTEEPFEPVVQQRAPVAAAPTIAGPRPPRRERRDRDDDRSTRPADRSARSRRSGRPRAQGPERPRPWPPGRAGRTATVAPSGRTASATATDRTSLPRPRFPSGPSRSVCARASSTASDVLAALPEEQRPIAELALQGIAAVRQRLREDNARLKAEGKPEMPEAGVMRMAEELIPRLRVADWLDRAEAAQRQLEHLDLRDLRSVVASADDPLVARDESTRTLAAELKAALVTKQEEELALWLTDVEAALDVGRVVRALRLSSVPPKAGVPFPGRPRRPARGGDDRRAPADRRSRPVECRARGGGVLARADARRPGGAGRAAQRRAARHRAPAGAAAPTGRRVVRGRSTGRGGRSEAAATDDAPARARPAAARTRRRQEPAGAAAPAAPTTRRHDQAAGDRSAITGSRAAGRARATARPRRRWSPTTRRRPSRADAAEPAHRRSSAPATAADPTAAERRARGRAAESPRPPTDSAHETPPTRRRPTEPEAAPELVADAPASPSDRRRPQPPDAPRPRRRWRAEPPTDARASRPRTRRPNRARAEPSRRSPTDADPAAPTSRRCRPRARAMSPTRAPTSSPRRSQPGPTPAADEDDPGAVPVPPRRTPRSG